MNNQRTRMLVEGGIIIALGYVLSNIKVFEMPNGGSITAVSMLPAIIYAIRWGVKPGLFVAGVYGLLQFILGPKYSGHIVSILCDYVLGFGVLGLSGILGKEYVKSMIASVLTMLARFVLAVISGIVVYQVDFVGSVVYNATYMIPEIILTLVVFTLVFKPLQKFNASVAAR